MYSIVFTFCRVFQHNTRIHFSFPRIQHLGQERRTPPSNKRYMYSDLYGGQWQLTNVANGACERPCALAERPWPLCN